MTGSATHVSSARGGELRARLRLDPRGVATAALGAGLVLSVGLTDGGYYGRSATTLTLAFAAMAALGAIHGGGLSRAGIAALGLVVALFLWTALSANWAASGALVEQEARRTLLYASGLAALLFVLDRGRRRAALVGLATGISLLGAVAVGMRAASGEVVDRFYGTLLEEPVGYPNALGVLAAIGVVVGVGLGGHGVAGRGWRGSAAFLVLVLGLTGSRGGALALAVGLGMLVALGAAGTRPGTALRALAAILAGSAAWAGAVWTDAAGASLVVLAVGAAAGAAFAPDPARVPARLALPGLACAAAVATAALVVTRPVDTTSSFRTAYWRAALEEAVSHPSLGSGAGTFHLTWEERGDDGLFVRDAHSLYVETLSELGPVGLALVLAVVALPLSGAFRRRGDPLVAVAGAGFAVFAVHAGLDWDWEMPVVTLAGLGCAAVLLSRPPKPSTQTTE